MQAKDIIKTIMKKKNINQADITGKVNLSQSSISSALSRDMKSSIIIKFLKMMDCELIIRDKSTGQEYSVDD